VRFETATVKPTVNFPEAHPYWAGLLLRNSGTSPLSRNQHFL
jgi:hypothetical protein